MAHLQAEAVEASWSSAHSDCYLEEDDYSEAKYQLAAEAGSLQEKDSYFMVECLDFGYSLSWSHWDLASNWEAL